MNKGDKKDLLEKFKKFVLNKNISIDRIIEEILEEIIWSGKYMKEEILEKQKANPSKFISTDDAVEDRNEEGMLFLGILANHLEKIGIITSIEREPSHDEVDDYISFILLFFIMSGMIYEKKYDLYFDLGEEGNKNLFNNKEEQIKFNNKLKEKIALKYKISENLIKIFAIPSKDDYKIHLYINTKEKINIDDLSLMLKNEEEFKEMNNLKKFDTSFLLEGCILSKNMLDTKGNKENCCSTGEQSGWLEFTPPEKSWKVYNLNVYGKFDGGNNDWTNYNGNNEWAKAYRVAKDYNTLTHFYNVGKMQLCLNYEDDKHKGNKIGYGIYFSNDYRYFDSYSDYDCYEYFTEKIKKKYKIGFISRVKVEKIRCSDQVKNNWILNGNTDEIRPYSVLIKELEN